MIKKATILNVSDKCGVWTVKAFHLYKGFNRKTAYANNFIKASVKTTKPDNWIGATSKVHGIVMLTKFFNIKPDGSNIRIYKNTVVLLKKRMTPRGKELFGPVLFSLRKKKFRISFPGII